jgi:putative protease
MDQLIACLASGADRIYADFADIRQYADAVARAREQSKPLFLATPRIQKPSEMGVFQALVKHEPDGILVRNLGGLKFYAARGVPIVADFSLNAANPLAMREIIALGAGEVTASYDLNREQLLELLQFAVGAPLEVVVHQHMPMFHMEHCVFCSVLSPGTNATNCGRPCDRHTVRLRDRIGYEHLLTADVGCRNTLFNATAQSAAEVLGELVAAGARRLRIELLDETGEDVGAVFRLYAELLAGRTAGKTVIQKLRAVNRVGVTRGTFEEKRNPLAIL